MSVQQRYYTTEDLALLPDDGKRYEIAWGELIEMPTPTHDHALVSGRVLTRLTIFAETHDLGVVTGSDGGYVLQPDANLCIFPMWHLSARHAVHRSAAECFAVRQTWQ
jgi:Uma2 family endonuclease